MTRTRLIAALVAIAAALPGTAEEDLVQLRIVRGICASLLGSSSPFAHEEASAFVIERGGHLFCLMWRQSSRPDCARWDGPIPDGTVAIFHTHPNWLPLPSTIDASTARRTHLPVYVVTRSRIMRTTGDRGEVVATAWN